MTSAVARASDLLDSGSDRIRQELRDTRDRFIASDPGAARLRQGLRALVALASTIALEAGLAALLGRPAMLPMLIGSVVAVLMASGVKEGRRRAALVTVLCCPVAAVGGVALGVLTAEVHLLGLVTFVLVSFAAVWVRRFGPRWFTLGFLTWQSFFFALFLDPPVQELPFLLLAVLLACVWVGALLLTVLHEDPEAKLRRVVAALRARARTGVAAALEVIDDPGDRRKVLALRKQLIQLREVALLLDGQLADERSLPEGASPGGMRRWTVDIEIGMDELCSAAVDIADGSAVLGPELLDAVRRALTALGWDGPEQARDALRLLDPFQETPAVRRLSGAAGFLLDAVQQWDSGEVLRGDPGDRLDDGDFEPVITLVGGNLPGSAALAERTLDRDGAPRFGPSRLRLTTRQAVQAGLAAALAIVVGEAISPQRYFWAVIAAFIAFAGTATSGETLSKGVARISGTLVGLVASVWVAELVDGRTVPALVVIAVCIFGAFFLQPVSYTAMIFFVTVLLGQLYTLLGTFSSQLLELRLEETVAGAVIGILVSLLVLPTHSRATLRVARKDFLDQLGGLLDGVADTLDGRTPENDLIGGVVGLDAAARQLIRLRRGLTRGRLFGGDRVATRHRVSVLSSCAAAARTLAVATGTPGTARPELAEAARTLATEARRLADVPALVDVRADENGGPAGDVAESLDHLDPSVRPAVRRALRRLADGLALLGPRPVPEVSAR
ncbi:hypothetical protein GIS00_04920 [Nakamurella sp. YIM 132087]|uniref:Integral membrane bound transporter domain-containing protein n=1 Tax=Nakamurella alba TaxID=2665158 RepID=A0A7K1FGU6_9ACTN|nr:FUSC family protein [Nakamurella alba]MTD13290.1 hypothetical protein [Nakamurella alba]